MLETKKNILYYFCKIKKIIVCVDLKIHKKKIIFDGKRNLKYIDVNYIFDQIFK